MKTNILKRLLLVGCLLPIGVVEAKTSEFYEFQTPDFQTYEQFKTKYLQVNLVLSKCTGVDGDLTSEKQYRCLQKINTSLTNANSLLYSKLDKFDRSDYTTGLDRGYSQAVKGCDSAYAPDLHKRFKNQILKCKLQLQLERINFIANRSLPYYKDSK